MSKAKGTRAEHRTIRVLEAAGYRCCRAAASLGEWDVIAIGPGDVRLIQVKCGKNPYCPPAEMEAMTLFAVGPGVRKELWKWRDWARQPEIVVVGG